MTHPHVVILGAGPAGVGAAYRLRFEGRATVTILERRDVVGGNAGSFEAFGQRLDYGSHRLHPACEPEILADIRGLLGEDGLLKRPRHGRILLRGRWVHFPLKPIDLLLRLDRQFAIGATLDMISHKVKRTSANGDNFASVLKASLGSTICDHFYFPYARKIWGRQAEDLSGIQARRRVSANSFSKLLRKVASQMPGYNRKGAGAFFYYPRNGFGQISEAYAEAARNRGAELLLGWSVERLQRGDSRDASWTVVAERDGDLRSFQADYVWSTIPVTLLAKIIKPDAPPAVLEAARSLEYRAMLLIYLELPVDRFTEFDAHYFPDARISITRLSEPKNYADRGLPSGRTTICAELPCSAGDEFWKMSDAELARLVSDDLKRAGIPLPGPLLAVEVRRLPQAYPIYALEYKRYFDTLDEWVSGLPRLLSFGRQGLFAHDNTHHALYMAYAAASCLEGSHFNNEKWGAYRKVFETHVVED